MRWIISIGLSIGVIATIVWLNLDTEQRYITASPSLTQRFNDVASEKVLIDFCYRMGQVYGVTGVSYRDYSPQTGSAIITVYYDPAVASLRELNVLLHNSQVIWQQRLST